MSRKYTTDGHNVRISKEDYARIKVGTMLREVHDDGSVPPFADSVVIGISIGDEARLRTPFDTLADAIAANAHKDTLSVNIHIARPYLYANSVGLIFNCLQGVERSTMHPYHLDRYCIVEMSTGEPASYDNKG